MSKTWGGNWTEQKLDAFEKYVKAYLTIMYKTRERYNGWPKNIIYFDGFAGSGVKDKEDANINQPKLEGLDITPEEENIYRGSCERVLRLEKKFDRHFLVDIDNNALCQLKNHLNNQNISTHSCEFISKDVNEVLHEFLNRFTKDDVALVLLDPFGMQIKWETIQNLKDKRVDLWILLPSGVIINRLLDKKGKLSNMNLLKECLGLDESQIKENFYTKSKKLTLFDETEEIQKIPDAITKIAELYVQKLQRIFRCVTKKPLELKNSRNVTIYHFIFASNNQAALKIAGQIIETTKKKTP